MQNKRPTSKEARDHASKFAEAMIESLNISVRESKEREKRWVKIMDIEMSKWPFGFATKSLRQIPRFLHPLHDWYVTRAQKVAREACATSESAENYLRRASKKWFY